MLLHPQCKWVTGSVYEQIHKIELYEVWVDGILSSRSTPFTLTELLELAKEHKLPQSIAYKRRLFPKDYQRKAEVDDCITHYPHENRIVSRPYIPDNDPSKLSYFYLQAEAWSFELHGCPSLYEEAHNLPSNEPTEVDPLAEAPALPENRVLFKVVPFKSAEFHSPDKLVKVANFYIRTLNRWDKSFRAGGYIKRVHHDVVVNLDLFTQHYRRLKEKYNHWVVEWQESTDPQKFVFEDVGIAAFLISLWEMEAQESSNLYTGASSSDPSTAAATEIGNGTAVHPTPKKQSFVDLGCGNGFLVYILTMEGYPGRGIDLQKRKIWDRFPAEVKLIEAPIDPTNDQYEEDWILANHSDELTPWIPFIASRNNRRFWVLPCCEWNFDSKFTVRTKALSRYEGYLEYVKKLTAESGYKVEVEHLRIPSTRNISIVGRTRTIDPTNSEDVQKIKEQQEACLVKARFKQFAPRAAPPKNHGPAVKRERKPKDKGSLHPSRLAAAAAAAAAEAEAIGETPISAEGTTVTDNGAEVAEDVNGIENGKESEEMEVTGEEHCDGADCCK